MGAAQYEIVISGRLGAALTKSFEGLEVSSSGANSLSVRTAIEPVSTGIRSVTAR